MSLESYRSGIEALLSRQDISEGVRGTLHEIITQLDEAKFNEQTGTRSKVRGRLRGLVNGLQRRQFMDPPLPTLLRELGKPDTYHPTRKLH